MVASAVLVFLFAVHVGVVSGAALCPIHPTHTHPVRHHGDFCYQFHLRENKDFAAAQAECRGLGGQEVIIRDLDTQNFLADAIRQEFHYSGVVWIGLTDALQEGTFIWVDGSPLTFSYWAQGEPSSPGEDRDCVAMDIADGGHWSTWNCQAFLDGLSAPHPHICVYPTSH